MISSFKKLRFFENKRALLGQLEFSVSMSFISASVKKVISLSVRIISLSFENLDKSNGNLLNLLFDKLMEESEFVWDKNKF
jgi:hypothetical protein